jgi:hypothetical protein
MADRKGEWHVDAEDGVVKIQELREAIANLLNPPDRQPPETALFFFSVHAWRQTIDGREEVFLVTSDVLPSDRNYGISLSELGDAI